MMSWQNYIAHLLKDHLFRVGRVNFNGYCNKSTVSSNACSKCNVWPDSIQVPEQNGNAYLHIIIRAGCSQRVPLFQFQ